MAQTLGMIFEKMFKKYFDGLKHKNITSLIYNDTNETNKHVCSTTLTPLNIF